jgi:hypothetical protein
VVPGRPSRANGRGGPRLAAGGARTLAPDRRGDLRRRGLDRQGELLAATKGEVSPLDPLARARRGPGRRRRLAVGPAGRRAGRLCLDLPPGLASDLGEPHGLALELAGLILILEGQVSLIDALDMKIDKAAQEGIIFFPCASAPCKAALGCQIDSSEVSRCLNEELVKLPIAS